MSLTVLVIHFSASGIIVYSMWYEFKWGFNKSKFQVSEKDRLTGRHMFFCFISLLSLIYQHATIKLGLSPVFLLTCGICFYLGC